MCSDELVEHFYGLYGLWLVNIFLASFLFVMIMVFSFFLLSLATFELLPSDKVVQSVPLI